MLPAPPPLPALPPAPGQTAAALEASRRVVEHLLRTRSAEASVRELAEVSGLSERTFYRYFPRKEDAMRPYLEAGLNHVLSAAAAAPPSVSLRDALVQAHAPLLDRARSEEGAALLAVIEQSERNRALWLSLLTDAEARFAALAAERLGLPPRDLRVRVLAAAVVAAGRLALEPAEQQRTPSQQFAAALDLLGADLLPDP